MTNRRNRSIETRGLAKRSAGYEVRDRGDTLIEVLITVLVVSITGVALLLAFSGAITGSTTHRNITSADVALRTVAENVYSQVQLQQSPGNAPLYNACATTYSSPSNWNAPTGYSATVNVSWWYDKGWQSAPPSSCASSSSIPQQLTVSLQTPIISASAKVASSLPLTTTLVVSGRAITASQFSITSISPDIVSPKQNGVYLVITGTGFTPSTIGAISATSGGSPDVVFTGTGSATSSPSSPGSSWVVDSSTAIVAEIDIGPSVPTGTDALTLALTDGSRQATKQFSVSMGPSITSVSPSPLYVGSYGQPLVIAGTNFDSGAVVAFESGSPISFSSSPGYSYQSSTEVDTTVDVPTSALPGSYWVTVTNADGQVSNQFPVVVAYPAPVITKVSGGGEGESSCNIQISSSQSSRTAFATTLDKGRKNTSCTVTGKNFYSPQVTVTNGGGANSCNPVSISNLTLTSFTLGITSCSNPGTYDLTVSTPGGSTTSYSVINVTIKGSG